MKPIDVVELKWDQNDMKTLIAQLGLLRGLLATSGAETISPPHLKGLYEVQAIEVLTHVTSVEHRLGDSAP